MLDPAQTIADRYESFLDFVFVSFKASSEIFHLLDELVTIGFYVERRSPTTLVMYRRGDPERPRCLHHLDYSTDFSFEWAKVFNRLSATGLDREGVLILNEFDQLPDFAAQPTMLSQLVPCLT